MEPCINTQGSDKARSIKKRLEDLSADIKKLPTERIEKVEMLVRTMGKQTVSLKEAAEIFGVSIETLRRAIKAESLRAFQINRAGIWKISVEEIERFLNSDKGD